ncbi:MAG: DUF1552 domain-containing protein, partial [Myxococcales bacterium]|nr:DUF1552 domain-containing protein [Myxococcales bacterium]
MKGPRQRDLVAPLSRRNAFPRRAFLGGVGAGALALPFLHTLRAGAADIFPKRFVVFFTPNGTIRNEWVPTGGETDFKLKRILQPLEEFREHLLILEGVDMKSGYSGPGDGHQKGMGTMLTGAELLPGDVGGGDSSPPVSWASSISIDQYIANNISADRPYRSIELGVHTKDYANIWTRMIYAGPSQPLPPEANPYQAFDKLFGDLDVGAEELEKRKALRRSVLDSVKGDFASIQKRLGVADRHRMQSHMDGVREIEKRLESAGVTCAAPTMTGDVD